MTSDQFLVPFEPNLPVVLTCDASLYGLAAVMSHTVDGEERPVAYASRALSSAEQGYSQLDREALALVFVVGRFFKYLYGIHVAAI